MGKQPAKKKRFTTEVEVPDVGKVDDDTFRTVVRAAYNKEIDRITTEKFNPWLEDLVNARNS